MDAAPEIEQYVRHLVGIEDDVLVAVRARHETQGLPPIQISAEEGQLIAVLLRAIAAQRVLEVGTLGGYSGVWIARAVGADGRLITIESKRAHARVARQAFRDAEVTDRVELIVGDARDVLPTLEPAFDAVFLDADKESLPAYFAHAMRLLRVGGLLLCDNTFYHGRVLEERDRAADVEGMRAYNELAARDPRLSTAIVPVRDGLMISLKVRD